MYKYLKTCVLLILLLPATLMGRDIKDSLWHVYKTAEKPDKKINALLSIASEYDLANDVKGRDSIFDIALDDLTVKTQDTLLIDLYNWYFDREEEYFTERSIDYARDLDEIVRKYNKNSWFCLNRRAAAKVLLYQYKDNEALEAANQAFYYASLGNDPVLKVRTMLLLGYCLDKNEKKIEAFKKYTDALYLSRKIENSDLVYMCYEYLGTFYYLIDNREKAKEYGTEQYKILLEQHPIDSLALMRLNVTFASYLFDNKEQEAGEKLTWQALNYTIRHGYKRLKQKTFITYRTFLINNSRFKELSELYTKQFPGDLAAIALNDPKLFFRLKAFILEADGNIDSAQYYYTKAEESIKDGSNSVYVSNFYKRYGEFLIRRGKITDAESKLKLAYEHAEKAQYIPYLTELTHELDSLSYSQGKVDQAYKYAQLNLKYNKQSELDRQQEKLLKIEVENEARQRELIAEQEAEAIERNHNIQYMGISIVIILSFIVLAMLGRFKVHRIVIKSIGFFSFIFFFEFIIMLADHKIHHITHGEPWKFLAFKIVLIGMLLPFHHWIEEKVIHYLVSRKLVDASRMTFGTFIRNIKNNLLPDKKHDHEQVATEDLKNIDLPDEEVIIKPDVTE